MNSVPYPAAAHDIVLSPFTQRWTPDHDTKVVCALAHSVQGDILEIGCNNGTTTRELALQFPERTIVGLDFVSKTPTMVKEQHYEIPWGEFGKHVVGMRNVELLNQNSRTFDYSKYPNLRIVFIDGDHSYAGVKADTELALGAFDDRDREFPYAGPRLIMWHDVHPSLPDWCQVWSYLETEIAPKYPQLAWYEGSHVAALLLK